MTKLVKKIFLLLIAVLSVQAAFAQTREEGIAAMQMEKWDKAISIYSALTKAKADDQDAWLTLSNAYMAKGDKTKALEALKSGFDAKPEGNMANVVNARTLLFQDKPAEADEQFKRASNKGKKDVVVLRQIAESFLFYKAPGSKKSNLTRTVDLLKAAYEVGPKDYPILMALGYVYREEGDGGEAARHYEFASQFQPKNPLPVYMTATVYKAAKINDKYMQTLEKAIATDNYYVPALRAKADHLYFTRKYDKARDAYQVLLSVKSPDLVIEDEMQYANTLFLTKDYQACADLVEKIIAKDGSKNYLRRLLGYSYYENNEYEKGQAIMDDYFRIVAPEKIIALDYIYQGRLLVKAKKDTVGGIAALGKAIQLDSAEWPLYLEMYSLAYSNKDYCGAAKHLQTWVDSTGAATGSKEYYQLGTAYFYCKADTMRYQNALKNFVKVTELSPAALVGWFWSGKAAARLEPDLQKDTSAAAVAMYGIAQPYFTKYIELASVDSEKNKKDLITSYEYMVYYYYVKKDDVKTRETIEKLLILSPDNKTGIGLRDAINAQPPPDPKK